jgi:hypothetical protein
MKNWIFIFLINSLQAFSQVRVGLEYCNNTFVARTTGNDVRLKPAVFNTGFMFHVKYKVLRKLNLDVSYGGSKVRLKIPDEQAHFQVNHDKGGFMVDVHALLYEHPKKLTFVGLLLGAGRQSFGANSYTISSNRRYFSSNDFRSYSPSRANGKSYQVNYANNDYNWNTQLSLGIISENHLKKYFIIDFFLKANYFFQDSPILELSSSNQIVLTSEFSKWSYSTGVVVYVGKMKKLGMKKV